MNDEKGSRKTPGSRLEATLARIQPIDSESQARAQGRAANLAIPAGSLGRMMSLSVQLAAIQGTLKPAFPRKAVVVMAGDHGVVRQGVSAFPADVTPQMVANFVRGEAAINALARTAGARVLIVDAGVDADLRASVGDAVSADLSAVLGSGGVLDRKVRRGAGDITQGPAMSREEAVAALEAGIEVVEALLEEGLDLVATGDMGIGNTTPSSALACVFTGRPPADVTGRGTGIDDRALGTKRRVVEAALAVNRPDPADPVGVLSAVGGLEIGGIAGVILGGAAAGIPVVVDGFISTAGALVACALAPETRRYLIAGHRSMEPGHRIMQEHLGISPLLDLDLRLGEGTGAALAMPLVDGAAALLREMATFSEAGVDEAHAGAGP
jgi:nicotinate-nucleotide--dimethylbenzimidazole phosphoribosyltransferase